MMENELPEGWVEIKIEELTTIIAGGTPSTSVKEYFEGNIPWITPADLSGYKEKYIFSGRKSISKSGLANSSARLLPKGSVLFSSRAPIGYVAIAANELATNQGFKSLTPNKAFDSSFAYYYLKHIKDYAESQASGTTFKELSGSKMGQLPFLLPPLAEQTRIVTKLDAAFGHLETLKTSLTRIPELLKKFRQTVLNQAVTGKLTEGWREENPDYKNKLDNIFLGLFQKADDNNPDENIIIPENWSWDHVGKIAKLINGDRGKNYPNVNEYVPVGIPFINTGHIMPDGSLSKSKMNFISREKFNTLNGGKIEPGDLVYCLRGATMGKTAIVDMYNEGAIASSLVIIRPKKGVINKFLYYYLISPFGKKLIKRFDNGSAQPNLSANSVKTYPFPLPSLEEQQEIVNRVEALFATVGAFEAQYQSLKAKID